MKIKIVAPIFGFEKIDEVTLEEIDDFFVKLESENISFTLIDPSKLREYSFEVPDFYKELLKIETLDDVKVYNTVIISSDIKKSTINFAAPIVINKTEKLLAQIALDESKYSEYGLAEKVSQYL